MTNEIIVVDTQAIQPVGFNPDLLAGQVRASTIAMYKKAFKAYIAFAGSWSQALEPATLAKWRTVLAAGKLSPNTINRMLSSVRAVMKSAAEQGYTTNDIAQSFDSVRGVKVGAMKDKLKDHARTRISKEDMRTLCDAPLKNPYPLTGAMHRALLLTLASSGARISEVVTLKLAQIEDRRDGKKIGYVIMVSGKTDEGLREAPLSVEAYEAIQSWVTARAGVASEFIFTGFSGRCDKEPRTKHITTVAAWQTVKRYAKLCKLEHIKPHDFRRFIGTSLAKVDARDAQKALGHKDINTTYKHYVLDDMKIGLTDGLF